jgi:hypothetical protein
MPLAFSYLGILALTVLFTSCGGGSSDTPAVSTEGARDAAEQAIRMVTDRPSLRRPSAALGVFTTMYLAQNSFTASTSALKGVEAMMLLLAEQHPVQAEETFLLLEEFGTVLQVDIADLLNRSQNRPETLNNYMDAFGNITERARRKALELEQAADQLKADQRTAQADVRSIERSINDAKKTNDFATVGSLQEELSEAEKALAEVTTELEQTNDVLDIYNELVELADKRKTAIEENRQIIIAGLQVVDVPGIEDLGIIEETRNRARSRGNGNVFGL